MSNLPRCRKSRKNYPDGVLLVADSGAKHFDRYTVFYEPEVAYPDTEHETYYYPYVGMSEDPFHPQGFGQHGTIDYRYSVWGTNDKVIDFEDLPTNCQQLVKQDLEI